MSGQGEPREETVDLSNVVITICLVAGALILLAMVAVALIAVGGAALVSQVEDPWIPTDDEIEDFMEDSNDNR